MRRTVACGGQRDQRKQSKTKCAMDVAFTVCHWKPRAGVRAAVWQTDSFPVAASVYPGSLEMPEGVRNVPDTCALAFPQPAVHLPCFVRRPQEVHREVVPPLQQDGPCSAAGATHVAFPGPRIQVHREPEPLPVRRGDDEASLLGLTSMPYRRAPHLSTPFPYNPYPLPGLL